METKPLSISNIFAPRARYCVPIFQRHYVWTKEDQWEPLWDDVVAKAAARIEGRDDVTPHYFGAVVLEARRQKSVQDVQVYTIIDGQQRLTTFQVFLSALRDVAAYNDNVPVTTALDRQLNNPDPELMEDAKVEVYKVWPTQHDREIFADIVSLGSREAIIQRYEKYCIGRENRLKKIGYIPPLLKAYFYFYDCISKFLEEEDEDVPTSVEKDKKMNILYGSFMNDFRIVEIQLSAEDDAQVIFETLNARSTPLTAPDLLRNYIFMRAEENNEVPTFLYEKYWGRYDDVFWEVRTKQGRLTRTRLEFFVINFLTAKKTIEINQSKIYPEYKSFIKGHAKYDNVESELRDLNLYSDLYALLVSPPDDGKDAEFARTLDAWDITTAYPLAIEIMVRCDDESERATMFNDLESYIVRRAVCNLTTKNYNKIFLQVLKGLTESDFTAEALRSSLTNFDGESTTWPNDDRFKRSWCTEKIYTNLPQRRIRDILLKIEKNQRSKFSEEIEIRSHLSVEHVMPVNWEDHWPLKDGTIVDNELWRRARYQADDEDPHHVEINIREGLYHTIGNLTLLTQALNSSISNGAYQEKRKHIIRQSKLGLNSYFQDIEKWDTGRITERAENLFEAAVQIWPHPSS